jgi:hypothetical protein
LIVYLIVRKTGETDVGLCRYHADRRSRRLQLAWSLGLSGLAVLFLARPVGLSIEVSLALRLIAFVIGLVLGISSANLVVASRIDDGFY